jgi:ATP-dependent Lhr-like helicase
LKKPPHILITTPESLYLLLTARKGRGLLANIRTVIVDEIHAIARDKRGSHLALSLERLNRLTAQRPTRIGLSATQRPIEEIARFLVGTSKVDGYGAPACGIIDAGHRRDMDLAIEVPEEEFSAVGSKELWNDIYDRIADLVREHKSTLVFVNTRRLVVRATHALSQRLGEEAVAAHHGSLSKRFA